MPRPATHMRPFLLGPWAGLLAVLTSALGGPRQTHADSPPERPLPPLAVRPGQPDLPDPFRFDDGARVAMAADWQRRRAEIKAMLLYFEYGLLPPAPARFKARTESRKRVLGGRAVQSVVQIQIWPQGGRGPAPIAFHVGLTVPRGRGPFPAIIKNDTKVNNVPVLEEAIRRGYVVADYNRHELDQDNADRSDGAHPHYPEWDWGTLAVWAWGTMRVVDYLDTLRVVDKSKLVATGHSRGGKTALLATALDPRIAIAVPNGSGAGGCGQFRFIPADRHGPWSPTTTNIETLAKIVDSFPYWFAPRFVQFSGHEDALPFDQHFLKALVAPRPLLCTEALGDHWANPQGAAQTHLAAQEVYDFLGAPDNLGIHYRAGYHEQSQEDWLALLDFADLHFFGKPTTRDFKKAPFPGLQKTHKWSAPRAPAGPP